MVHLLDILFFRAIGVGVLYHETATVENSDKWLIAAGISMFFMPDWVRGKDSPVLRALTAGFTRGAAPRTDSDNPPDEGTTS